MSPQPAQPVSEPLPPLPFIIQPAPRPPKSLVIRTIIGVILLGNVPSILSRVRPGSLPYQFLPLLWTLLPLLIGWQLLYGPMKRWWQYCYCGPAASSTSALASPLIRNAKFAFWVVALQITLLLWQWVDAAKRRDESITSIRLT